MYYAYVHARPNTADAQGIFYVGKGKGRRCYHFSRRTQNPHYTRVVKKNGAPLVGKFDCSSEAIAFELERGLIKCLRRMGVSLTNLSDGGEGQSGYVHTAEVRKKLSAALIKARENPALRKHHSQMMVEYYKNPESRRITGAASSRAQNTPEALAKRSAISKVVAKKLGAGHFIKMSNSVDKAARAKKMKEVNLRPEKIERQRATITAVMNDPVFKAAHTLKMKEVGATPEFRAATATGTKLAVNKAGVQDRRRAYLRAKFAYLKAFGLPRYYRGATKAVVFAWLAESEVKNG